MSEIAGKKTIYISLGLADIDRMNQIIGQLDDALNIESQYSWEFKADTLHDPGGGGSADWAAEIWYTIQNASAALLLLSPAFFQRQAADAMESSSILQTKKTSSLPVFSIILEPCKWQGHEYIDPDWVFPKDLEPLSTKSDEAIEKVMTDIAREISSTVNSLQTGKGQQASTPEQFDDKPARASGPPPQNVLEDKEEWHLVPLEELQEFDLSPTATRVLKAASAPTLLRAPISTSTLFFSMVEEGFPESASPSNTPGFLSDLMPRLGSWKKFEATFQDYVNAHGIFEVWPIDLEASPPPGGTESMTEAAFATFEKARRISSQTTDRGEIHAKHLLAALISQTQAGEKIGFRTRLEELEIPLQLLQNEFVNFVKGRDSANEAFWDRAFPGIPEPPKGPVTRLAGFQADDAKGEVDWLDIDTDVNAFAALIASRTVSPPLSIGLFGEWGSGKTFFMRRLRKRVDKLSEKAQESGQMQRDLPYYKRIAQIEFNAWHYVESNLWASLVEHIFSNLRVTGDKNEGVLEKLQKHLLNQLNVKIAAERQADERVKAAENDFLLAQSNLEKVEKALEEDSVALQAERARDLITEIELPAQVQTDIEEIRDELNLTQAGNDVHSFIRALNEARNLVNRGSNLLTPLVKAKNKKWRLFWLIVSLLAAPILIISIMLVKHSIQTEWMTEGIAILTGIATFLATMATWIRSQAGWIANLLGKAEHTQQQIDAQVARKESQNKARIDALEQQIDISKVKFEAALQEHEAAKQHVAEAWAEQRNSTTERLLTRFIEDRVASDDYRKHLGVLAIVRDDFEKLSEYIEKQNWRLSPVNPSNQEDTKEKEKFLNVEDEEKEKDIRINRIVLYIDDLDRCPPNKVVDVLQAVHLLLAFPLFVVVVGVDARWVTRSLEARYRELLHGTGPDAPDPVSQSLIGAATPGDYLEKIFQVPFWLNPMDQSARGRMVGGLLKGDMVRKEAVANVPIRPAVENGSEEGSPPDLVPVGALGPGSVELSEPAAVAFSSVGPPDKGAPKQVEEKSADTEENLLDQQKLEILQEELDFINELTPLLGRSPRSLKRFVNVYRLIKAGLSDDETESFSHASVGFSNSHAVLFLLAVDTGAPSISGKLFGYLRDIHLESLDPATRSTDPFERIKTGFENDPSGEWAQVKSWLQTEPGSRITGESIHKIGAWVPRVARYSFQARKG
jgi:hypothetical protein